MSLQSAEQPYSFGSTPHLSIGIATRPEVEPSMLLAWGKGWTRLTQSVLVVGCLNSRNRVSGPDAEGAHVKMDDDTSWRAWKIRDFPQWCPRHGQKVCPRAWIG